MRTPLIYPVPFSRRWGAVAAVFAALAAAPAHAAVVCVPNIGIDGWCTAVGQLDRVGVISDCRATASGLKCRQF